MIYSVYLTSHLPLADHYSILPKFSSECLLCLCFLHLWLPSLMPSSQGSFVLGVCSTEGDWLVCCLLHFARAVNTFFPFTVSDNRNYEQVQPFLSQILSILSQNWRKLHPTTSTEVKTPLNGDQKNPLPPLSSMRSSGLEGHLEYKYYK